MRLLHPTAVPFVLSLLVAACGGSGPERPVLDGGIVPPDDDGGVCEDTRTTRLVYFGTPEPTQMPLSEGQILAIGDWGGCSGTFVADDWVLTAAHCGIRPGREFCVGTNRFRPDVCFTAVEVETHPRYSGNGSEDITLVRMDAPASSRIPSLVPIPVMTEVIDSSWFGTILEAAGYGTQEDGSSGEREFTAEPLVDFEGPYAVIDGQGERGVCFGDSGGPVMLLAPDSTVRVLGVLSWGDPSCLGRDRYTRADRVLSWIEQYTGPTVATGGACGRVTAEGDCMGDIAIWCEDDVLASERCEGGTICGWDGAAEAYRCLAGDDDPCDGVSATGECDGDVARWCDRGVLRSRDCGACGEDLSCQRVDEVGGFYCGADPCAGLDYLGECRGDIAVWCDEGTVRMQDCSRMGLRCGYINDRIGYFCGR